MTDGTCSVLAAQIMHELEYADPTKPAFDNIALKLREKLQRHRYDNGSHDYALSYGDGVDCFLSPCTSLMVVCRHERVRIHLFGSSIFIIKCASWPDPSIWQ